LIQVEARMRNIDSNIPTRDSIVADSYFAEPLRRLLQQYRPTDITSALRMRGKVV